jgi:KaiC/GvpD/RAD55 family RecA-like ATPase
MSSWAELLDRAEPGEHVVQLYGADDQLLTRHVSRYLAEGLRRGDGLVLIATGEHGQAILRQLNQATSAAPQAIREGRLVSLDAAETLSRFMRDGEPDRTLFESEIGAVIQEVRGRSAGGRVRAFGEMVGLLWTEGNRSAAIQLEEYWNELMRWNEFSLFCGYPIDLFDNETELEGLHSVLGTHTHLLAGSTTLLSSSR